MLEAGRGNKPPDFVLNLVLGYVANRGTRFERDIYALALIFVQVTVLVLILTLVLESDDDKTDENVEHKEGNDDNVRHEEYGHGLAIVVDWTLVLLGRVNRFVKQTFCVVVVGVVALSAYMLLINDTHALEKCYSPRPALERDYCKQSLHAIKYVVKMELVVGPLAHGNAQLFAFVLVECAAVIRKEKR